MNQCKYRAVTRFVISCSHYECEVSNYIGKNILSSISELTSDPHCRVGMPRKTKANHPKISNTFATHFKPFLQYITEITVKHIRKENTILNCSLGLRHFDLQQLFLRQTKTHRCKQLLYFCRQQVRWVVTEKF